MEEAVMSTTVAPDKILRELSELWVAQAKEGEAGVLRACSMTLVVLAEESDDPSALGETVAALMPEHPARAVLIRLRGAGERELTERVYQQCWKPFGQRQQICCEQIELTASDAALADLPSVVLPLAVPDLPVILWCRSARLTRMAEFGEIAKMAAKVVLDSGAQTSDCTDAIGRMLDVLRSGALVGDLAWTRLTRWREMLARAFEDRDCLAKLPGISEVRVSFGAGFETAALYMGAWAVNALKDAGVQAKVQVTRSAATLSLQVELAGGDFRVQLERQDDRLVIAVNALTHCTNLPPPSDYLLMREELGIIRRDLVFERTLASAARLAVSSSSEPSSVP
jgi:glucose-6-phosphate dehydrogenase assembly protein OpcA